MNEFHVYDTTLRDGAQQEGLNLSVADKVAIAGFLDQLGVGFIEGGWPGANPKDTEFFARARDELDLRNAVLAAFGSTRRAGVRAEDDPQVRALLEAQTPVVTLVAKSHSRHVTDALRTTREENLAMVHDTVALLRSEGRRVFLDAEHFFDGYRTDREYAVEVLRAAADAGADVVALCDTNGGMLPPWITEVVSAVAESVDVGLGIHCHNDAGCAVANSVAAVEAGAMHVQGTVNGYGERTGNADLVSVVANLQLKLGREVVDPDRLAQALHLSHAISEVTNVVPYGRQPYVGASAFAHKAGLHASALRVDADLYQHIDPAKVGNSMRTLVSDMAGRASIELKGQELGYDLSGQPELLQRVVERVKSLELQGWTFDAADASFELLLREEITGDRLDYFDIESWRIITESESFAAKSLSEATVKLRAGGRRVVATGEGNGPVNALDHALREALADAYPELAEFRLSDFRVRILDTAQGTDATTRVLIETTGGDDTWDTIGVAPNIVHASWIALVDSFTYGLMRRGVPVRLSAEEQPLPADVRAAAVPVH
ncbi:citramalate synthase [Calidifontibacter sp. DB0510]|uniref:Citramalate synthase n=1 Tax=Metallococcus carri TaxID=1656884 RepID=A0A967EGZ5_9MICO|nr:citramalate synthase [Metallococcus carri]NHN55728.1 citramalate synthase [Metallococcus carri]NOP38583.1 citramalate synthase [Calidifontibacter sp. DB2511S]